MFPPIFAEHPNTRRHRYLWADRWIEARRRDHRVHPRQDDRHARRQLGQGETFWCRRSTLRGKDQSQVEDKTIRCNIIIPFEILVGPFIPVYDLYSTGKLVLFGYALSPWQWSDLKSNADIISQIIVRGVRHSSSIAPGGEVTRSL